MPSTLFEDTAPSASLDHLKAWRSPQLTPRPAAKTRRRFRTRYEGGRFSFRFEEPLHRFQNMVVDKMVGKSPYLIPEGDGTPYCARATRRSWCGAPTAPSTPSMPIASP